MQLKMKTYKKIFLACVAVLSLSSCSDFLDKESDTELTIDEVFSQRILQERWLAQCYSHVEENYWWTLRDSGTNVMGDDLAPSERWEQWWGGGMLGCLSGNWNSNTGWNGDYWAACPRRIRECLIFQQRATAVPEEGLSKSEVELMKLETRFLVAYYYQRMLLSYGPIPFRPGYLAPTEFNLDDLMTGPEPFDDIVDWIENEYLEVSKLLPASYTSPNKYGRATSLMCLAARARLLLFAASPLCNGNPDYANHVDNEGRNLFSTSYDANKWKKAADACKLLIDKAHEAGCELFVVRDKDGNIDPFLSYQNLFLPSVATDCKEILFARQSTNFNEFEKHSTTTDTGGNGGLGVTQEFVDAFFMKNGRSIDDPYSGYVENGFSTEDEIRTTDWTGGEPTNDPHQKKITHAGTYNMYVGREPRFYVSVIFHNAYYAQEGRYYDMLYKHADNNGTHDAPQNGYLNRKRVHPDYRPNKNTGKWRPGILYRLGEAYLNYAEALNETGGPASEILFYVNKIRERAGILPYTTDAVSATDTTQIHVDNTKDALREIIRKERRIELSGEDIRYDDLRRWKEAEKVLNGHMHGMNFMAENETDFFQRVTVGKPRVYKKSFYWWPVHQSEMDKNPNLVQGPYWDTAEE